MKTALFALWSIAIVGLYRVTAAPAVTFTTRGGGNRRLAKPPKKTVNGGRKGSKSTTAVSEPAASNNGILSFPKNHPFAFQMMVATLKTAAADLIVQRVADGKNMSEVDWKRNGIFVVFGFFYLGGFQWWLMVNKYRQWFPTMDEFAKMSLSEKLKWPAGMLDATKMVLFDLLIHMPFLYFPAYYTVKEFVSGDSWNPADWVQNGVSKYIENSRVDLKAMAQLWGPSDCVQFMLPIHIRMPFRHLVSFFWTAYVSFTRGAVAPAAVVEEVSE